MQRPPVPLVSTSSGAVVVEPCLIILPVPRRLAIPAVPTGLVIPTVPWCIPGAVPGTGFDSRRWRWLGGVPQVVRACVLVFRALTWTPVGGGLSATNVNAVRRLADGAMYVVAGGGHGAPWCLDHEFYGAWICEVARCHTTVPAAVSWSVQAQRVSVRYLALVSRGYANALVPRCSIAVPRSQVSGASTLEGAAASRRCLTLKMVQDRVGAWHWFRLL